MELRRAALGGFLETIRSEVVLWSSEPGVQQIIRDLVSGWDQLGANAEVVVREKYADGNPYPPDERSQLGDAGDGSAYSVVHADLHPRVRRFVDHHHYYDAYMVDARGDLVYSVHKEDDFGTNLVIGPYRETGLGRVVRAALEAEDEDFVAFTDFEPYEPSGGEPASFLASPAFDETGSLIGVLAFRVPTDRVGEIMHFTEGMGKTGETYIVGVDGLMRSDSRFAETSTILVQRVETEPATRALRGESGVGVFEDYRGEEVFSAYGALQFEGVTWAVIAEQDRSEVRGEVLTGRRVLALTLLVLGSAGAVLSLLLIWITGREERPTAWTEG
jgi:methyl-accepting chemotaxis protein